MTLSADSGMTVVSYDDVVVIAQDVWASFLDMHVEPVPGADSGAPADDTMAGVVEVSDAWRGAIVLECPPAAARTFAAAMFEAATVSDGDVADALGELTNMIGGNIKSLLPAPSRLSLPVVQRGPVERAGAVAVSRVSLAGRSGGDPVRITVWQD